MTGGDDYPPIGDYALIGDCRSAALIARDGSIEWCCLPRFDAGSAFARMLDRERGGHCSIVPTDGGDWSYSREYLEGSLVLRTTLDGSSGEATITDCFVLEAEGEDEPVERSRQILRIIDGRRGSVPVRIQVAPRFDYGEVRPWIRRHGEHLHTAIGGNDAIVVWCEAELKEDPHHELSALVTVSAGDRLRMVLTYWPPERIDDPGPPEPDGEELDRRLEATLSAWRAFAAQVKLRSRDEAGARRSAMVLKALTYGPTGAIVAAPTTSLPEAIGAGRNWDYRFAWVRDSSFSSRAFTSVGCLPEADKFRQFITRSAAGHAGDLQVMYGVGGERRISGEVLGGLEGYRGSSPVRAGNDAAPQLQLDAYGELVNLTWRWHRRGHSPTDDDWRFLVSLIDHAAENWSRPDSGIWEWPGEPDHFVHSKVLCWAALDRGLRLAEECLRRAPTRRWKRVRDEVADAVEHHGYDRKRGVYLQAFDRPELDCALLLLPTVEYVRWDDERMTRTVAAVREELRADGNLLYRYTRDDGLAGREGAFLCCSFWLVECLARSDQLADARAVFNDAIARANDLGLFSEELDPHTGELLGNFPQGLTHLAHIDAAVALAEVERGL